MIGYQDLDANGTWRTDATYGNVWHPNRVSSGWAPYRDGHWAWVDPWGWTWIDDAPWGFAVSHYGRWANLRGAWAWVPGPVRSQAYYAPALVVFVGGNNFQVAISSGNVGGVGWFPLGPREVYQPSYTVSRSYFENINISNTVVNTTVINNYYNNSNVTNVVYANRQVAGAIIAVPTTTFVQSQPVSRAAVRVTRDMVASAPLAIAAAIAPTQKSVRGNAAQGNKPPAQVFERPVVARTAPPAAQAGFRGTTAATERKTGQTAGRSRPQRIETCRSCTSACGQSSGSDASRSPTNQATTADKHPKPVQLIHAASLSSVATVSSANNLLHHLQHRHNVQPSRKPLHRQLLSLHQRATSTTVRASRATRQIRTTRQSCAARTTRCSQRHSTPAPPQRADRAKSRCAACHRLPLLRQPQQRGAEQRGDSRASTTPPAAKQS